MISGYAAEPDDYCSECGIPCVKNRTGRWFHVDALPQDAEPHDVVAISAEAWRARQRQPQGFVSLRDAARDMLAHHVVGHPESQCSFAQGLREALGRTA